MFPPVDTQNASAVAGFVVDLFTTMFPGAKAVWLDRIFRDIEDLFLGTFTDFSAIDLGYHDLEHTFQATVALAEILAGRHLAMVEPRLTPRQYELAIAAALLHDTGYLKHRSDRSGTGAKYTYCHVLRSCAFTASYLPVLGANEREIEAVLGAINCTGPSKQISRLRFREPIHRIIGCAVATGDYLGQMAAKDYPEELGILYREFEESDNYIHVPMTRRTFKSAAELIERTPAFWKDVVIPKLESDFEGVYRFLSRPYPGGPNAYIEAVERNIVIIKTRSAVSRSAGSG